MCLALAHVGFSQWQCQLHRTEGETEAQAVTCLCEQLRVQLGFLSRFAWLKASVLIISPRSEEGVASKGLESCSRRDCVVIPQTGKVVSTGESHCSQISSPKDVSVCASHVPSLLLGRGDAAGLRCGVCAPRCAGPTCWVRVSAGLWSPSG